MSIFHQIRLWVILGLILTVSIPSGIGESLSIQDKTLVSWVYLSNTTQRGGSALTVDNRDSSFDGIVFGEISAGRWMAGSDSFKRSQKVQDTNLSESTDRKTLVQIAIIYKGKQVSIYRDGKLYADYSIDNPKKFGSYCVVIMGLRHLEAGDHACLAGSIEDARIYNQALTAEQISSLKPNQISDPKPLAWWNFEEGKANDVMGVFPYSIFAGNAKIEDGKLQLDGNQSYMTAVSKQMENQILSRSNKNSEIISAVRQHRANLLNDPHRPVYHFVNPEGYAMPFDPNGAIFWKGQYHLCYIFQDERGHCWGHATSTDLLHWRFRTPALYPSPGDPDHSIFSGNAFVNKKGEAVLLYHGVDAGNCIATSSEEELEHWTKSSTNPIIPNPKEGEPEFKKYRSWDPHGWLEGDTYYAIFGGTPGATGIQATVFKSTDMIKWTFLHNFLNKEMPGIDADEDISCPDFFKLGDKHMLLCISHKRGCRYYLGRWENETFYPEFHARMNWSGGTCFAPESLLDDKGRRIMWAWVLDWPPKAETRTVGWSGVMSLPRVLSLSNDGILLIEPVEELKQLRLNQRQQNAVELKAGQEQPLKDIRGDSLEIAVDINPGDAKECGLKVRCSPDGKEQTVISYNKEEKTLKIDVSKSTLDKEVQYKDCAMTFSGENPLVTVQPAPLELKPGEPLQLRIFMDHSIIEVFANHRQCITQRIYPTRPDSQGISLFSTGGTANFDTLTSWTMVPTNSW